MVRSAPGDALPSKVWLDEPISRPTSTPVTEPGTCAPSFTCQVSTSRSRRPPPS
jgi:hypothetical protein